MHQESFSSGYDIENQLKCYFVVEAWIEKKNNIFLMPRTKWVFL